MRWAPSPRFCVPRPGDCRGLQLCAAGDDRSSRSSPTARALIFVGTVEGEAGAPAAPMYPGDPVQDRLLRVSVRTSSCGVRGTESVLSESGVDRSRGWETAALPSAEGRDLSHRGAERSDDGKLAAGRAPSPRRSLAYGSRPWAPRGVMARRGRRCFGASGACYGACRQSAASYWSDRLARAARAQMAVSAPWLGWPSARTSLRWPSCSGTLATWTRTHRSRSRFATASGAEVLEHVEAQLAGLSRRNPRRLITRAAGVGRMSRRRDCHVEQWNYLLQLSVRVAGSAVRGRGRRAGLSSKGALATSRGEGAGTG